MAAEHGRRLLERERELARIEQLADEAIAGRGQAVAIEGPPGVGKTRLLEAGRDYARQAGMQVLTARATELERSFSFGVVRQLFAPALLEACWSVAPGRGGGPLAAADRSDQPA